MTVEEILAAIVALGPGAIDLILKGVTAIKAAFDKGGDEKHAVDAMRAALHASIDELEDATTPRKP